MRTKDRQIEVDFFLPISYNIYGSLPLLSAKTNIRLDCRSCFSEVRDMAMAVTDLHRRDELLNRLKRVWGDMSREEQSAVEVVVNSIILNHAALETDDVAFPPLTEVELFERIDLSLSQADAGGYTDAETFEKAIETELHLL